MTGEYDEITDDVFDEVEEFDKEEESDEQEYEPLDETEEFASELKNEYEPRDENQEIKGSLKNNFYPLDENEELRNELHQYHNKNYEKTQHKDFNDIRRDKIVKEYPERPTREKPKNLHTWGPDKPLPPPLPKKEKPSQPPRPRSQSQHRLSPYKKLKEYLRKSFKHPKKLRFTKTTEQLSDEMTIQQYKSLKYKKDKN